MQTRLDLPVPEVDDRRSSGVTSWLTTPRVRRAQYLLAGLILMVVFTQALFPAPTGVVLLGAVNGAIAALGAMGIVLIYRTNRVINFAQGDIGAVGGVLGVLLIVAADLPFFLAMGIALVTATLLGGLAEVLFVRRFTRHPRLILTVATIGIAQLFQAGELLLPKAFDFRVTPQITHTPVDFLSFRVSSSDPIVFGGRHLLAVLTVIVVTAALAIGLRSTRIGIGARAAAESLERAAQLGVPVKRINTIVWMVAGALSALSLLLQAPIAGVPVGVVLGPAVLLRALAAAVIGRMESLPVTFGAAVVLGVVEQSTRYATGSSTVGDALLFAVIVGAFLVQRRERTTRADDASSSWSLVANVRPVPPELRALPEVRWAMRAIPVVALGLAVLAPLLMSPLHVNLLLTQGILFALLGLSLVVLTGWAGEISLGQVAFFALGAATAARVAIAGRDPLLAVLLAGLVGAACSLVVGLPALRVRGPFLAVATLGMALTTSSFFLDPKYFPWFVIEDNVAVERPVLFGKFDTSSERVFYYALLAVLVLVLLALRSLRASRAGRVLIGARDNPKAAQSFGISVTGVRLWAFAFSGFIAAIGGGMFAFQQEGLARTFFAPQQSLVVFAIVVVGGLSTMLGALLGAAYYTIVSYLVTSELGFLFLQGLGLLVILLLLPGGLSGLVYDARDRLLRSLAVRRGIDVPSLTADRASSDGEDPRLTEPPALVGQQT